jgi:2-polyprenyl-3-methyl-5-hydroxy-6-metoxy-1,4-benzoquinol methylase
MNCRHCRAKLRVPLIDLGHAPPSNAYLRPDTLHRAERTFPLRVLVCESCWLAQTEDFADAQELFTDDYAYFSGVSSSWLAHAERYVSDMATRFGLDARSHVVEVAANDGYLLQYVRRLGIPCLGVEPTASTAEAARAKGIDVVQEFFGTQLAERLASSGQAADLMVANNVLAHVPDINDFAAGFARLLKPGGVATFEFPHLLCLMEEAQFDTIYHEHYSYLSLLAVTGVLSDAGLEVFDVQQLPTHGGSLRVFAQRRDTGRHEASDSVARLLSSERRAGMEAPAYYASLQPRAERIRDDLLRFLREAKSAGRRVAAYGAAAKGNTLLNFAGAGSDLISYVVDRSPSKQGKFMPGSRLPIVPPDVLESDRPDFLLVLPWNIIEEVRAQNRHLEEAGTRFVTAIPELRIR